VATVCAVGEWPRRGGPATKGWVSSISIGGYLRLPGTVRGPRGLGNRPQPPGRGSGFQPDGNAGSVAPGGVDCLTALQCNRTGITGERGVMRRRPGGIM